MKRVEVHQLQQEVLLGRKEALVVEDKGKTIGYFYPVNEKQDIEKLWERLDQALEKAASESGLDKETLLNALDPSQPFPYEVGQVKP
jgi:putative ribosome biogenesis GTPase RsgA